MRAILYYSAFLFFLSNSILAQTAQDVQDGFLQVDEKIETARKLADESNDEDLPLYVEKKIEGIQPLLGQAQLQEANGAFSASMQFINIALAILDPLIALSHTYINTLFVLERNQEAIERAEEMVAPDNYLGLNQIQGANHFYLVHALGFGLEQQKQQFNSEPAAGAVSDGANLQSAEDNSKRSMDFVQKAIVIARDEANARRFIELTDKAMENLEEMDEIDEEFYEEVEEEYAQAEETYSLNNFKLASRQYEDLLKKINQYLIANQQSEVSVINEKEIRDERFRKKRRKWMGPWSYTIKGGANFFSVPENTLDDSTRAIILSDTAQGGEVLFESKNENPWNYNGGLEIKKKGIMGGANRYQLNNYSEWSTYSISNKLTGQMYFPTVTITGLGEVRHNTNFEQSSYAREYIKLNHRHYFNEASNIHLASQLLGESSYFYKDTSDSGPSFIRGGIREMVMLPFGMSNEAGMGVSYENKTLEDERRSYHLFKVPLLLSAKLGPLFNLWWSGAPAYRNYLVEDISDRASLLSYSILSMDLSQSITLSLIEDMEFLLYEENPDEFRDQRLQSLTTLRLSVSKPSYSATFEYSFDFINNKNAISDDLYEFNRYENQTRNRFGVNGYWVAYKSVNYSLKLSTGVATGVVHHYFKEDDFYQNMIINQDYVNLSLSLYKNYGLDVSYTFDGGWDRSGFFENDYDLLRNNSFFGVNFYAHL